MEQKVSLNHLAFYVADISKSCTFYHTILGLEQVPDPFNDDLHAWFSLGGNLTLHLIQGTKEEVDQYRSTHTCFSISNLELFINQLQQAGINYEDSKGNPASITLRADGIKQIYFKDPDGYWIEINNDV